MLSVILSKLAAAGLKYKQVQDLKSIHPTYPDGDIPRFRDGGCARSHVGSADARLLPEDFEGFEHGYKIIDIDDLPDEFDMRNVLGRNFTSPVLQQHMPVYCGGCWAFGVTAALNDRFIMLNKGAFPTIQLSPHSLLTCGKTAGTCEDGGDPTLAYWFAKEFGIQDTSCHPSLGFSPPCTDITRCMNCDPVKADDGFPRGKCRPQMKYHNYHVKAFSNLPVDDPEAPSMINQMKAEIYTRGSISCSVDASSMEDYIGGIITDKDTKAVQEFDHVITVSGWGVAEDGTEYWIVKNSWGTHWGELGWFRVEMGLNVMLIESICNFAIPEWPPREYNVPAGREVFFNGHQTQLEGFLWEMEEAIPSPNEAFVSAQKLMEDSHFEKLQSGMWEKVLNDAKDHLHKTMKKMPRNVGASYKIRPICNIPYVEWD